MSRATKNTFFDHEALIAIKHLYFVASNANRHAIMTYIKNFPGMTGLAISVNCRMKLADINFHLVLLERENLVKHEDRGRNKRYFLNEAQISALNEVSKTVLMTIKNPL